MSPQSELKIAYKWIIKAAYLGDLEAIELLTGYDADRFQAMGVADPAKWLLESKNLPVPQAVKDMDVSESFRWLQRAAELGHPEAIYVMGLCYSEGYLVPQSDWFAFENFLLAANRGWGAAQFKLGRCYATGTGTALTAGGRGNVTELDDMLQSMWDNYKCGPTVILANSQEVKNITSKVLSNASGPLLRYDGGNVSNPYAIVGNGIVEAYYNPFALGGGYKIPIILHPNVPAGTLMAFCENLPAQYQSSEVPNVAEMKVRKEYQQTFWPQVTRSRDCGVYVEETLAVYAPFATAVISNIATG